MDIQLKTVKMTRSRILQFETKRFPNVHKHYIILGYISIPTGVFSGKWIIVQEGENYIKCPKPAAITFDTQMQKVVQNEEYVHKKFTYGKISFLNSKFNVSTSPNTSSTDDVNLYYLEKLRIYIIQANVTEQIFY